MVREKIQEVINHSLTSDWKANSDGDLIYKLDGSFYIEKIIKPNSTPKVGIWEGLFTKEPVFRVEYLIRSHDLYLDRFSFIIAPSTGLTLPIPALGTTTISIEQFHLARVLNADKDINALISKTECFVS